MESSNDVLVATLIKGLLIVGTGRATGRELLERAGGYCVLSRNAFTTSNSHQSMYMNALHDFMQDTEATIDGLMQLSQLQAEDEERVTVIANRLVQICR